MRIDELIPLFDKSTKIYICCGLGEIWSGTAKEFEEVIFSYSPFQNVEKIETTDDGEIIITAK